MMTVPLSVPHETQSLIQTGRPTLYPVRIDPQHPQLKHRISTRNSDVIYYCSSHEIFALHLKTRRKELVKSLSWAPQCLDAKHGWICAGGDKKGQCAFIRILGEPASRWPPAGQRAEVDELLPLNLDPANRSSGSQEPAWSNYAAHNPHRYILHYFELGTDIVNSVTIHRIRSGKKGVEDDVVVVVTNNDKTVRIFSLSQFKPLASLHYPINMNHASMSPDSEMLLAVGDDPQIFFYRRIRFENLSIAGEKTYATYGWQLIAEPRLPFTPSKDSCFSTSFSPTGHLCAVASQSGVITIYDLARISPDMSAEQAVICTLKTSRSSSWSTSGGAVRSIDFSPAPWDLLVWAEDHGQVSVIDLREPPISKQTLELNTEHSAVFKADLGDHFTALEQRQLEIERRSLESQRAALEARDRLAVVNNTADFVEYAISRSRREREDQGEMLRDAADGLTESERRMIDTIGLRRARLQDDDSSSSSTLPMGVAMDITPNRFMPDASYSDDLALTSSLPAGGSGIGPQTRSTASISEYVRQRNLERMRSNDRVHQPRRRTSVLLSTSGGGSLHNSDTDTREQFDILSTSTATLAPIGTTAAVISASPSHSSPSTPSVMETAAGANADESALTSGLAGATSGNDPWQTITDAFTSTYAESLHPDPVARSRRAAAYSRRNHETQSSNLSRASSTLQQLMARNERQRSQTVNNVQRLRQLQAAMADQGRGELPTSLYEVIGPSDVQALASSSQSREGGVPVMGAGWSADGRSLYVGTEDGILEYAVNIRQRMQWPGVSFM